MAIGCYTAPYLQASYKGVPFDAMRMQSEFGRRGAEGEFPFGEDTAYADLGRRIRTYSLSGRFVTNEHINEAAALIAAVESPGPGTLVHPTLGALQVACKSLVVHDDQLEEQGVTYIDLEFIEANDWVNGFNFGGTLATLALTPLIATLAASFVNTYTPAAVTYFRREQATAPARDAILNIKDEFARASQATADATTWQALVDLQNAADAIYLEDDAAKVFETFRLGVAAVNRYTAGDEKYSAFKRIANYNSRAPTLTGVAGVTQNAVATTMVSLAAAYMAAAALETKVTTINAALLQYGQVTTLLEQEVNSARLACDNPLFIALRNLLVKTQTLLLNRAYNLPALIVYNFSGSVHSLVAAYQIHNDAKRFVDIESANPSSFAFRVGPQVIAERT